MTLNPVQGNNRWCGPAVVASIAGITTDDAAAMFNQIRGRNSSSNVSVVNTSEIVSVLARLGWRARRIAASGTLFGFLSSLTNDGYYLIYVKNHVVVILKNGKDRFFVDNHTKTPIGAGSSARLMQQVQIVWEVTRC